MLTSVRRINGSGVFMLAKISEFMVFATVTDAYLPMRECVPTLSYFAVPCFLMGCAPRFASFTNNADVEHCFCDAMIRCKNALCMIR